ncbi:hypothetical protein F511_27319 [Dorcoceras hygrometricum]|uniref:Uncharacterized protein n=1 Tax=Dorcoceras hygrometricum TaxID=472368 RepID=A0A2Z7B160_9LAMI|nr:hypothetical protein F511_27319 [Dorcoceras hygrometricum]
MGCSGQARTKPRRNQPSQHCPRLAGRRPHGGGRRQQIACGAWPHAGRNSPGQATPRRCTTAPHHRNHVAQGCRPTRATSGKQRSASVQQFARPVHSAAASAQPPCAVSAHGCRARICARREGGAHGRIGYPRMRASGESSTTKHRLLHASGSHPIPPPNDPKFCAGRDLLAPLRNRNFGNCCSEDLLYRFLSYCAVVSYQDARASGDTALSSPCWDLLATMHRVVNYHSSWARQRCSPYWGLTPCPSGAWFVSLFVLFSGNPGFTAGRGFNPAGGAPGGG